MMKKLIKIAGSILLIAITLLGGSYFMDKQAQRAREDELYRHAFSLLEEQIATYIVENYDGISKVEFSPIYVVETDLYSMGSINIVPVIYDEYGNRAVPSGKIKNVIFPPYGFPGDISSLDFTIEGRHIIYLGNSKTGEEIDVSSEETLPEEAKLIVSRDIDEPIELLLLDGQVKDICKEKGGSPDAEIIYNLKIIRGEAKKPW